MQDGVLEVEGVEEETPEQMEMKYEGVNAHEIASWVNNEVVANVKGFRLVRKMRKQEGEEPGWSTIDVCTFDHFAVLQVSTVL